MPYLCIPMEIQRVPVSVYAEMT
ncbi:MAG: hypothetical protein RL104_594, partial [Bacteroidota bacterium]